MKGQVIGSYRVIAQVAGALAAAHARGIKPDNIFLVPNELMPDGTQVKLLDFGIAKLADEQSAGVKTQTGTPIGTPAYMSPEQCMGRSDLDHRTDLYSLGCILFRVLCGRPPFLSQHGTGVLIAAHMRDAPPDPRPLNPRVPAALGTVVLCLREKDPSARFQTAIELRNALVAAARMHRSRTSLAVIPGALLLARASVVDLEGLMCRATALPAGHDRSRRAVRRRCTRRRRALLDHHRRAHLTLVGQLRVRPGGCRSSRLLRLASR